jgi:hypothetical protein
VDEVAAVGTDSVGRAIPGITDRLCNELEIVEAMEPGLSAEHGLQEIECGEPLQQIGFVDRTDMA